MRISVMSVGMDLGADRRGVDMGPSAIRYAGLSEKLRELGHDVPTSTPSLPDPETRTPGDPKLKYLDQIVAITKERPTASRLVCRRRAADRAGRRPRIALGSVSGVADALGPVGLIWFDAHADFNTDRDDPLWQHPRHDPRRALRLRRPATDQRR